MKVLITTKFIYCNRIYIHTEEADFKSLSNCRLHLRIEYSRFQELLNNFKGKFKCEIMEYKIDNSEYKMYYFSDYLKDAGLNEEELQYFLKNYNNCSYFKDKEYFDFSKSEENLIEYKKFLKGKKIKRKTVDLLNEAINLGFTQEEALRLIDNSLDELFGITNRIDINDEVISEELYSNIINGFKELKEAREHDEN